MPRRRGLGGRRPGQARRQFQHDVQPGGVAQQPGRGRQPAQRGHHRGPAAGVLAAHPADMPSDVPTVQQGQQGMLGGFTGALAGGDRGAADAVHQGGAGDQPADPQRRGQGLGRGAQVDHVIGGQAGQRGQRGHVITELAVVVILDDQRTRRLRPGDQRLPPRHRQPPAQRVLVRGRGVDQPGARRQVLGDQAVLVGPARHNLSAVRREHSPGGGVPGSSTATLSPGRSSAAAMTRSPLATPRVIMIWLGWHVTPRLRRRCSASARRRPGTPSGSGRPDGGTDPACRQARRQTAGSIPAAQGSPGVRSVAGWAARPSPAPSNSI